MSARQICTFVGRGVPTTPAAPIPPCLCAHRVDTLPTITSDWRTGRCRAVCASLRGAGLGAADSHEDRALRLLPRAEGQLPGAGGVGEAEPGGGLAVVGGDKVESVGQIQRQGLGEKQKIPSQHIH